MSLTLDPVQNSWICAEGPRRIFDALKKDGGEARFVGGCVRDALIGRTVGDVDLACNLPPDKVCEILQKAGLKVSPTGITHGTVTAIVDHKGYEITSLRRDVETYGRKAKVEFTDDWQDDAARRDFTMNALYADADGKIYDYFKGREDLAQGHVRFIGNAEDRIREDVLRILRFFRFHAWFGKGAADEEGLKSCAALAGELPKLSAERIWREVNKLLAAENPAPVWKLMIDNKIVPHFLPEAADIARLGYLIEIERKFDARSASITRLAALLPLKEEVAQAVAQKLKLSNREAEELRNLVTLPARMRGKLDIMPFRRMLYEYGPAVCRAAALLFVTLEDKDADLEPALIEAANWEQPQLPLQGADLLKLGLKPGPRVGEILKAVEEWWIARDLRPGHNECLAEARKLLAN